MSNIWSNDKGLADFLELSKIPDYIVILVGLNQAQVKEFTSIANSNLIPIKRTQDQYELAMLYSLADVFVNPTYADMFPTVNLEALACGTPIVTYRTGGSPESVDNKTGLVVAQGDYADLVEAVSMINAHPFSSEDCRRRAKDLFDKDKCYEKYIDLYDFLVKAIHVQ